MSALPFIFTSDPRSMSGVSTRLIYVPRNSAEKGALLSWYSEALSLPGYFGGNWDALEECLRDLSWLTERRIVIHHEDIPLSETPEDQGIYIDILCSVIAHWKSDETRQFIVAFDPRCELKLKALARPRSIS